MLSPTMTASRPSTGQQLSIFDAPSPSGSEDRTHHALDETSWVDHIHAWLPESEALFAELAALAGWEQRSRWMFTQTVIEPRLTAEFPSLADATIVEIRRIGDQLSQRYGVPYDSAWLNLYRDHNDSTGWHADRPASLCPTAVVPVLSLGATRRFLLRPSQGGRSKVLVVKAGDLVVMGGRCQRDWVHAVPKETVRAGARISVNFGSSSQACDG